MTANLELWNAADSALVTTLTLAGTAGDPTSATELHLWLDKGGNSGKIFKNVALAVEVEDPDNPGTWLAAGHPALDGYYVQAKVIGTSNPTNLTGIQCETTEWIALGTNRTLPCGTLRSNSARQIQVRMRGTSRAGTTGGSITARLVPLWDNVYSGSPGGVQGGLGVGILTGVSDVNTRSWVEARLVTANGSPDDKIDISRGWWVYDGISRRGLKLDEQTLNQNDVAAAALTSGQAYKVLVSQAGTGGDPTITKGVKAAAASAVVPTCPSGHMPVAVVTVAYRSGGTQISSSNIEQIAVDGRFRPSAGSGLYLTVGAGKALLPGTFVENTASSSVLLTASSTNRVWLTASGDFQVVTTSDTAPSVGCIPIASVTTDASAITAVTDKREGFYLEPLAKVFSLMAVDGDYEPRAGWVRERTSWLKAAPGNGVADVTLTGIIPAGCQVLAVHAYVKTVPGGTANFDIGVSGALTRYGTNVASATGTFYAGLDDGVRYYAAATDVILTFDTNTSNALGEIEVGVLYREVKSGSTLATRTNGIARAVVGYPWNVDRVIARLRGESQGGATGQTILDLRKNGTTMFTNGSGSSPESRPVIAAGSLSDTDPYPEVTTGAGTDWLEMAVVETTSGGTPAQGLSLVAVVYPQPGTMA